MQATVFTEPKPKVKRISALKVVSRKKVAEEKPAVKAPPLPLLPAFEVDWNAVPTNEGIGARKWHDVILSAYILANRNWTPDNQYAHVCGYYDRKHITDAQYASVRDYGNAINDVGCNYQGYVNKPFSVYKMGSDPEGFLFSKDGEFMPAWKLFKQQSQTHTPYWEHVDSGTPQYMYADGFAMESTLVPTTCHAWMNDYFAKMVQHASSTGYVLRPEVDYLEISRDLRMDAPDWAVELGCMSSLNAYMEEAVANTRPGLEVGYRTTGCHLHYEVSTQPKANVAAVWGVSPIDWVPQMVKFMDLFGGVLSVAVAGKYQNKLRRQLYGRAGEYRKRKKSQYHSHIHILEYRTHSSCIYRWPQLLNLIADATRFGLSLGCDTSDYALLSKDMPRIHKECLVPVDWQEVKRVINEVDVEGAYKLIFHSTATPLFFLFFAAKYGWPLSEAKLRQIVPELEKVYPGIAKTWCVGPNKSSWVGHNNNNHGSFEQWWCRLHKEET